MKNYNWPNGAQIKITDEEGELFCKSNDPTFDLSDNLMDYFDGSLLIALFSLSRGVCEKWSEDYLKEVEDLIQYDLSFDGYMVGIERLSKVGASCDEEYCWKLSVDLDDEDDE